MSIKYITVVNDYNTLYNSLLQSVGITNNNVIIIDNTLDNRPISNRYNDTIEELLKDNSDNNSTWLVFCHQDFYIGEDLLPRLLCLDKNCIYGPIGISSNYNKLLGRITQNNNTYIGAVCNDCEIDTLDAMCIIVNLDTVRDYNLIFDENFKYHFYVEDFCLQARTKGIPTRTLQMNCQHMSRTLRGDLNSREFLDSRSILIKKWGPIRTTTGSHGYPSSTPILITASILSLLAYVIYKEYKRHK
jgi:hypothetical protein